MTAVIDFATDLAFMSDAYRMSRCHVSDVDTLVSELNRHYPGLPESLVGASRVTVSAACMGAALQVRVAGVVIRFAVYNATRGGAGVSGFAGAAFVPACCSCTTWTMPAAPRGTQWRAGWQRAAA